MSRHIDDRSAAEKTVKPTVKASEINDRYLGNPHVPELCGSQGDLGPGRRIGRSAQRFAR